VKKSCEETTRETRFASLLETYCNYFRSLDIDVVLPQPRPRDPLSYLAGILPITVRLSNPKLTHRLRSLRVAAIMGWREMRSKVFGSGAGSYSTPTSPASGYNGIGPPQSVANTAGPPRTAPGNALHIAAPSQRQILKSPKPPVQRVYVTNDMVRELRELIRYRYTLDCRIWSIGQKVKFYQRDTVIIDMERADAALAKIKSMLAGWDREEFFATEKEFEKFREIKDRVFSADTRTWATNPPWSTDEPMTEPKVHEKDGKPIYYDHRRVILYQYPNGTGLG
jgi:hypothetical protein